MACSLTISDAIFPSFSRTMVLAYLEDRLFASEVAGSLFIHHILLPRNRHHFGPGQQDALSIALDSACNSADHVILSGRAGVAQVVQVGVAQFQIQFADPLQD